MESHRGGRCNAAAKLFLLLVAFGAALKTVHTQIRCYNLRLCQPPFTIVSTFGECCLGDGLTFDMSGEACRTCIVFGWINETNFQASERSDPYSLKVGYLKGADRAPGDGELEFVITDTPGTAVEGPSNDYIISTRNLDVQRTRDAIVQVTFQVDNVALEPDETLTLTLVPQNTLAMALDSNTFLLETIQLTIMDSDVVRFQFTESEYRTREEEGSVPVVVERNLSIATDVTLRITPVNFTEVNFTGFPFPEDFPDVPQFDPTRPIIANSMPDDVRDFNITPIEVTFPRDEINNSEDMDVPITVFDDAVNEADEVFVVLLEVVSNVPLARVDLQTRNASLCRIVDNDIVTVRFEQPTYTVDETELGVEVCIVKDLEMAATVDITLTTRDGTASSPADYIGGTFSVMIPAAPNSRTCLTIIIVEDTDQEEDEFFFVDLPILSNGIQTGDPSSAQVFIRDVGEMVNDTVVGDPLYTVPIFVPNIASSNLNSSRVFLCYEVHGRANAYFNLVTDECTSVNAHQHGVTNFLNVINQVGIRAVDNSTSRCRNIAVSIPNCSVEIDGTEFTGNRYRQGGIYIRHYPGRVRVSVPNCQELTLVMWIFCQRGSLEDPFRGGLITTDMIKYEVVRGLNFGHRDAHGLIGQFWNIPVEVTRFTGQLRDGTQAPPGRFVINVTRPNSEPRVFTGRLYDRTWEFQEGPCLYSGNRQAGPIYEITHPNDAVVEGTYSDYQVPGAFNETDYGFGRFNEDLCTP